MGIIYKRGNVFWIKYYKAGKPFFESSKSTKKRDANKLLKLREGQIVEGRFKGLNVEKVRFGELAEDFINDYRVNGRKSLDKAQRSVRHLETLFEGMRAIDITTDKVKRYICQWSSKSAAVSVIEKYSS